MNKTTTESRTPKSGYREHDKATDWQECDTCGLRIGAGMTTQWDAAYHAGDSSVCPRCAANGKDGLMCLPAMEKKHAVVNDIGGGRATVVSVHETREQAEDGLEEYEANEQADPSPAGAGGFHQQMSRRAEVREVGADAEPGDRI